MMSEHAFLLRTRWRAVLLIFTFSILLATDLGAKEDSPVPDDQTIQGSWIVTSAEGEGKPRPDDIGLKATFAADKLTFQRDDQDAFGIKFKLDSTQKPKAIDTSHELDPGRPIIQLGAYALEGDTLKLCLAPAGKPRPAKLETKPGDGLVLFVLKRAKKTVK